MWHLLHADMSTYTACGVYVHVCTCLLQYDTAVHVCVLVPVSVYVRETRPLSQSTKGSGADGVVSTLSISGRVRYC